MHCENNSKELYTLLILQSFIILASQTPSRTFWDTGVQCELLLSTEVSPSPPDPIATSSPNKHADLSYLSSECEGQNS